MSYTMPELKRPEGMSETEEFIFDRIVASRGKNKGRLRASKPKVDPDDYRTGWAAYVWRMVAFDASPIRQHQCMPVTADFDVKDTSGELLIYSERVELCKPLDDFADRIVAELPIEQRPGLQNWGRALGAW